MIEPFPLNIDEKKLEKLFCKELQTLGYFEEKNASSGASNWQLVRTNLERLNPNPVTGAQKFPDALWKKIKTKLEAASETNLQASELLLRDQQVTFETDELYEIMKDAFDDEFNLESDAYDQWRWIRLFDFSDLSQVQTNNRFSYRKEQVSRGGKLFRYDVTLFVNGFPLVLIELKRAKIGFHKALTQLEDYFKSIPFAENKLLRFLSIFVASSGNYTRLLPWSYFKSKSRDKYMQTWSTFDHEICEDLRAVTHEVLEPTNFFNLFFRYSTIRNLNNKAAFNGEQTLMLPRSYQYYAIKEVDNLIRKNERDFAQAKLQTSYEGFEGFDGGYIWHTMGSGKTLTAFKIASIAQGISQEGSTPITKSLLVVDRLDLNEQSIKEFSSFNLETNSAFFDVKHVGDLYKKLSEPGSSIHVTTIQKLARLTEALASALTGNQVSINGETVTPEKARAIFNQHMVMIFDECHRSQAGDMNRNIRKYFKFAHVFGVTGTPIFGVSDEESQDAVKFSEYGKEAQGIVGTKNSTNGVFGKQLHRYTIANAIQARTVLPFHVYYYNTFKPKDNALATEIDKIYSLPAGHPAHQNPERQEIIVDRILADYSDLTLGSRDGAKSYNGIFTVDSIKSAYKYYKLFQRRIKEAQARLESGFAYANAEQKRQDELIANFKVTTIYSEVDLHGEQNADFLARNTIDVGVNEKANSQANFEEELQFDLELADDHWLEPDKLTAGKLSDAKLTAGKSASKSRKANSTEAAKALQNYNQSLEQVRDDFEKMFSCKTSDNVDFNRRVGRAMKERKLDLLIVVNMYLTGFDAECINTLWVDRYLQKHTLIQAFSRTTRLSHANKTVGNVICFRNLQKQVDEAIGLYFVDKQQYYKLVPNLQELIKLYNTSREALQQFHAERGDSYVPIPEVDFKLMEEYSRNFRRFIGTYDKIRSHPLVNEESGFKKPTEEEKIRYQSYYESFVKPYLRKQKQPSEELDVDFTCEKISDLRVDQDFVRRILQEHAKGIRTTPEQAEMTVKRINLEPEVKILAPIVAEAFSEAGLLELDCEVPNQATDNAPNDATTNVTTNEVAHPASIDLTAQSNTATTQVQEAATKLKKIKLTSLGVNLSDYVSTEQDLASLAVQKSQALSEIERGHQVASVVIPNPIVGRLFHEKCAVQSTICSLFNLDEKQVLKSLKSLGQHKKITSSGLMLCLKDVNEENIKKLPEAAEALQKCEYDFQQVIETYRDFA